MPTYYRLGGASAPWGDYGAVLWNGLTTCRQEHGQSTILVSRAGPFVPPITFPFGSIIVTDDFRQKLMAEKFSGLSFEAVEYAKAVLIAWEQWDSTADEPAFYPASGEAEDYLLAGMNDENLLASMPMLCAWKVEATKDLQLHGSRTFHQERHPGTDVAREHFVVWVSERMKLWLEDCAGEWVSMVAVVPQ